MEKKRAVTMVVVLMILSMSGLGTGWTLAWLTAKTQTIRNVFTVGSVHVRLTETFNTDSDSDGDPDCWTGVLVPGTNVFKDPHVTVPPGCEDSWVFVQLKESEWLSMPETDGTTRKIDYAVEAGWQPVPDETNVYFRKIKRTETEQIFPVLKQDQVVVSDQLTKSEIKTIKQPKLTVAAYAIQQAGFALPEDAWKAVNPAT